MIAFIIRRLIQAMFVIMIISILAFAIKQNVGDPVREITGVSVSVEDREAIRDKLGLNDPLLVQYMRFAKDALQGDLGNSFFYKKARGGCYLV